MQKRWFFKAVVALLCSVAFPSLKAEATSNVSSPSVNKGVWQLEQRGAYIQDDDMQRDKSEQYKTSINYGLTDWYSLTVAAFTAGQDFERDEYRLTRWDIENNFLLTRQEEGWWLSSLARLTYKAPRDSAAADSLEAKLALAYDAQKWQHLINIDVEREIRNNPANDVFFSTAYNLNYKHSSTLKYGIELYNDWGSVQENFSSDEQEHRIGPVLTQKLGSFSFEIGYLHGISSAAPDDTFKWIVQYTF